MIAEQLAPPNSGLIGLPMLLDVEAVRTILNAAGAQVEGGRITYLRYKPKTNCIVAYQFDRRNLETGGLEPAVYYAKCSNADGFQVALEKARNHKWVSPVSGPAVVPFDEASAVFYAFPNDSALDGLRLLGSPSGMRRHLQGYMADHRADEWRLSRSQMKTTLLRYKPERRAVIYSKTKAYTRESDVKERVELYWRVCAENQTGEIYRRMRFLKENLPRSSGVIVPEPLGFDAQGRLLVMEAIKGRQMTGLLESDEPLGVVADAVERTGAALARLHGLADPNLAQWEPRQSLQAIAETKNMLCAISPELTEQVNRLSGRLQRSAPERVDVLGFVHGDFHYGNVLIGKRRIGLLDFDRSHSGSGFEDVGDFLAHLKLLKIENRVTDHAGLSGAFLQGYGAASSGVGESASLRWWTALSLFLLAVGPFRRLENNWPQMVKAILESAEEELC